MTKGEFLDLKDHARIKYKGSRPVDVLFQIRHTEGVQDWSRSRTLPKLCKVNGGPLECAAYCSKPKMPKTFLQKGVIVSHVYDRVGSPTLYYYGGMLRDIDPAEWELVDARKWVESETEYKRAKSYIPMVARRFKEETKAFLHRYKRSIEYKLDDLPLHKKLKLIMELSPEDKKWFGILNSAPEDVIALIEKAFENEDL